MTRIVASSMLMTLNGLQDAAHSIGSPSILVLVKSEWDNLLSLLIGMESPKVQWDASGPFVRIGVTDFRPNQPTAVVLDEPIFSLRCP